MHDGIENNFTIAVRCDQLKFVSAQIEIERF